ncbi:hypothetical protein FHG87_013823 [Trinorchestia longiramus]|nr:hypothetical protein FHG87_013823 [Trinorchestia longiramus]
MGIGVIQTKNEVFLEQSADTKALLSRFGMDKANSVATPVDINADLVTTSDEVDECDKDLYQSTVGLGLRIASSQFRSSILALNSALSLIVSNNKSASNEVDCIPSLEEHHSQNNYYRKITHSLKVYGPCSVSGVCFM